MIHCQIPQMPPLNPVKRALEILALSHKNITSIPEGYFFGFSRLNNLDLAHKALSSVSQLYSLYATLGILYLDSNRLQNCPAGVYNTTFTVLNSLYLSLNSITECGKDLLNSYRGLHLVMLEASSILRIDNFRSLHRLPRLTVSDFSLSNYNEISTSKNLLM